MKRYSEKLFAIIILLFFNVIFSQNFYGTVQKENGFILMSEKLNIEYYFKRVL